MEREVGGGIGMGNICKPMAVSFQCMTKSTTKKKKKKKELDTTERLTLTLEAYLHAMKLKKKNYISLKEQHEFVRNLFKAAFTSLFLRL